MARYGFFGGITDWTKEVEASIAEETASIARKIFTSIVQLSPVDTGRFVGNWQIGSTDVSYSTLEKSSWLPKIAEVNNTITAAYFLAHDKAYMVNNVDYAHNVEYDGWSVTDAYAPVANTLAKFSGGV